MKMGKLLLAVFCTVALVGSFACQRKSETTEPAMQEAQPAPAEAAPAQPATPEEGTGQQQGQ